MSKALIPALALAAASVAVALPAQAQSARHVAVSAQAYGNWQPIGARFGNVDRRIDLGVRNGQLSRREATRLRREFNEVIRLEARYRHDGLSRWERTDLDRRFDRLSAQVRYERRDYDNRRG